MKSNTVTFTSIDGKKVSLPLEELLSRNAVLASKVGGDDITQTMGAFNQLWVPGWPAKYFVRDIVDINFSEENELPTIKPFESDGHDFVNRPNVSVKAPYVVAPHKPITFEGYASDYDRKIIAVEFSLDQGVTWTQFKTDNTCAEKWVRWNFTYTPEQTGKYLIMVRAIAEDGTVSPIAATHSFEVTDFA